MKALPGQQLLLPFRFNNQFDFDLYMPGRNWQVWTQLQQAAVGREKKNIYFWGRSGSGKSHLLQAACVLAARHKKKPVYLPLAQHKRLHTSMLEGLEQLDLICLDELDCIAGDDVWEQAILSLFNRVREQQRTLLMTSPVSVHALPLKLPDLKSRLSWDLSYRLYDLDERERAEILCMRARARGFLLSPKVVRYLLTRVTRDMHGLFSWLEKIEDASISAKKKITIPFVKKTIERIQLD